MTRPFHDLKLQDPQAYGLMLDELRRQSLVIDLIASEEAASLAVLEAQGSPVGNKYGEGLPGARYYTGCAPVDAIEELARTRACQVFGPQGIEVVANVQPWCGSTANLIAYKAAATKLHVTIMGPRLSDGGHLTHGSQASIVSELFHVVSYGMNSDGFIDMAEVRRVAREDRPEVIIVGFSAFSRIPPYVEFKQIADEIGAILIADIAHVAGLIAAGVHPNPLAFGFHMLTMTMHKTLNGPRGGLIITRKDALNKSGKSLAAAVNRACFPKLQGGPDFGKILAKAVALGEAMTPAFRERMQRVVLGAQTMADAMIAAGFEVISGGTENHSFVVDFTRTHPNFSGGQIAEALNLAGLSTSASTVPNEKRNPANPSGIRFGSQVLALRCQDIEAAARRVVRWITQVVDNGLSDEVISMVRDEVEIWCLNHPLYPELACLWHDPVADIEDVGIGGTDPDDDSNCTAHGDGAGMGRDFRPGSTYVEDDHDHGNHE